MSVIESEILLAMVSELFADRQGSSENIARYLKFLCERFAFDCGCIYESDQHACFNLKEQYTSGCTPRHEQFTLDQIDPKWRQQLAGVLMLHTDKVHAEQPHELGLLEFFGAASLLVAAVVDEKKRSYGFIVLQCADTVQPIAAEAMPGLRFLLSALEKQISLRVYRNRLGFAQSSLESILDNAGVDIYVNDFYTHEILYANKSMAAPYGGKKNFLSKKCWEVLFPGQLGPCAFCPQEKLIDETGNPGKVYSWNYQRPFDGAWFRVFSSSFRWVDGRLAHVVSSADITENKRNEALIHYMANYDALTDLPNRRMLVSACQQCISTAPSGDKSFLLFFDIDGFKAVNDSYGHDAGDEFLVQMGKFFSSIPMLKDAIYRNGGDEFVALIGNNITPAHIRNLANFIHERFNNPWTLKAGPVMCSTSIGVACFPEDGLTAEELINKADQAMYKIKKAGGAGLAFYNEKIAAAAEQSE